MKKSGVLFFPLVFLCALLAGLFLTGSTASAASYGTVGVCSWSLDDNDCDATCDLCDAERTVKDHVYDNACDTDCNECGFLRRVGDHVYDNDADNDCNECGAERPDYISGDLDGVEGLSSADAIYLLYHALFGEERYPVNQPCDFNRDGVVNTSDATYLLYHTLFKDRFPL